MIRSEADSSFSVMDFIAVVAKCSCHIEAAETFSADCGIAVTRSLSFACRGANLDKCSLSSSSMFMVHRKCECGRQGSMCNVPHSWSGRCG